MAAHVYGVDLGTSNIKMFSLANNGIINQKNVIAIKNRSEIFSYGDPAFQMYEKAPENIKVSFPIKFGVIADIQNMEILFNCFYKEINGGKAVTGADFCIAVPTDITEVEKRAFYDVIMDAKVKSKKISVIEKPIADAVGVGIDVNSPNGHLLVNIGADTTEITVISLGGIVLSKLIKVGGNKLDEAICSVIRRKFNLIIGSRSAEIVKKELADAVNGDENEVCMAYGRNIVTGLPNAREITGALVHEGISDLLHQIVENIKVILERTPPELTADIYNRGIYLTGGSAAIRNLDVLIKQETGLEVNVADEPSESVIRGISDILSSEELVKLTYIPREKEYD
ncbi:MAG: rod shape-determining protein [Clostridiales bacterium]|nr:rod shape-determining protein [Clostridiales bacterium]